MNVSTKKLSLVLRFKHLDARMWEGKKYLNKDLELQLGEVLHSNSLTGLGATYVRVGALESYTRSYILALTCCTFRNDWKKKIPK